MTIFRSYQSQYFQVGQLLPEKEAAIQLRRFGARQARSHDERLVAVYCSAENERQRVLDLLTFCCSRFPCQFPALILRKRRRWYNKTSWSLNDSVAVFDIIIKQSDPLEVAVFLKCGYLHTRRQPCSCWCLFGILPLSLSFMY